MSRIDFDDSQSTDISAVFSFIPFKENNNVKQPLPAELGEGYVTTVHLGPSMDVMIHSYRLSVNLNGVKKRGEGQKDNVVFSFRSVFTESIAGNTAEPNTAVSLLPSVQISTGDMEIDFSFPVNTMINTIILTVHKSLLLELIDGNDAKILLQTLIAQDKPFLYEEFISPAIHDIAAKILKPEVTGELSTFYYRIRCEELILMFFVEFLKRKSLGNYILNPQDVKAVYRVRDKIISNLTAPPQLSSIAEFSGMSESKLNRIFKQIFGNPIYNYHQKFRIHEAAEMLKGGKMTVSEVGYKLGFTNLSHFSKLFKRYMGEKPKRFSRK
ncbi:AraC family transcriptional regulator [Pedobacter antarcticus]|uniref:helix-turn-helix domain-containing protein n=1 Tax=Pedobacter antarcticus TaxID=34086 RepID=UPI00292EC392|nr:AraC family transcriptional regulator [Pedobacter antarcticus]